MKTAILDKVAAHGRTLLEIFPRAIERDPVQLCRRLRRFEAMGAALALQVCNGPQLAEGEQDKRSDIILGKVNALLGNVNEYQPKTGARCSCRRGVQRDNCSACEGTGYQINFDDIRNRPALVPVFLNLDPRGYALKIDDSWMNKHG